MVCLGVIKPIDMSSFIQNFCKNAYKIVKEIKSIVEIESKSTLTKKDISIKCHSLFVQLIKDFLDKEYNMRVLSKYKCLQIDHTLVHPDLVFEDSSKLTIESEYVLNGYDFNI